MKARRADAPAEAGRAKSNRVLRGGSWNDNDNNLRAANRNNDGPTNRNNNNGFRCAKTEEILASEDALKHRGYGSGARGAPQSSLASLAPSSHEAAAQSAPVASAAGPPSVEPPLSRYG